jgi:hypothetical protein
MSMERVTNDGLKVTHILVNGRWAWAVLDDDKTTPVWVGWETREEAQQALKSLAKEMS